MKKVNIIITAEIKLLISAISITLCFITCIQKKAPPRPATIYVSGTITDKHNGDVLDSVMITLIRSESFTNYVEGTYYTNVNGKFSITFNPIIEDKLHSYNLHFNKNGYCYESCSTQSLSLYIATQNYNIQLVH